ncbi:HD-GYP domain-containing protein [Candidatus Bipolaricaulota bacterium]|nr:HD-GYP domain-containing protein [Candidatus Bipolaricaulota bacterium]
MKVSLPATIYVLVLAIAAIASIGISVALSEFPTAEQLSLFSIFVVLAVLAEVYATWIPNYKWEISSSIAIYLAALFILGPHLAVLLVFLASLLSEGFLRWRIGEERQSSSLLAIIFNISQLVLTVMLAGSLLNYLGRDSLELVHAAGFPLAVAIFVIYLVFNLAFVTGIVCITEKRSFFSMFVRSIRQFFMQYLVLCVSALLLAALYSISVGHVFLALFPLTLVHVSFQGYVRLQTEARNTFERISQLLDARDHYTAVHSVEVAELAVKIGEEMGLGMKEIEWIDIAARVHDIGKIAIPDSILLKPGKLDENEWVKMREHPVVSAELIAGIEIYLPVAEAVRHEHERWNGTGYPDGLEGVEIPLISRVIAAADIYNALSTDRPYREAFDKDETKRMINEMIGIELDPEVASALLRVIERLPEDEAVQASTMRQQAET